MKNKLITIAAMLAVMVAMTGIVGASPHNALLMDATGTVEAPVSPISIAPGETQTYSYKASQIFYGGTNYYLPYTVSIMPLGTGMAGDISVWTNPTGLLVNGNPSIGIGDVKVTLNTYRAGAAYSIIVKAEGGTTNPLVVESGQDQRTWSSIPEFPTVALPVGAAIGLMFLFHQRKSKKE